MSLEDPFFVVKDEVEQAVASTQSLYTKWKDLFNNPAALGSSEYEWTTDELKNSLKSIEWDLEDLEETISIVETNPERFRINQDEIANRKAFTQQTRQTVKDIREHLARERAKREKNERAELFAGSSKGAAKQHNRYEKLEQNMEEDNQAFIEDQRRKHKMEMEEQDRHLEKVGETVGTLKMLGQGIGRELDEQNVMLEDLDERMDSTDAQLNSVVKKVEKILDNISDRKQFMLMGTLALILVALILIYIFL